MDALLLLLAVPPVTAFIGYITNLAAVFMIFNPAQPFGIGPLRWQGIVYRLAPKFTVEIARTTANVLSPDDVLERVAPEALLERPARERHETVDEVLGETLDHIAPGRWKGLPAPMRQPVAIALMRALVQASRGAVKDVASAGGDLLDIDLVIKEQLSGENADRLARVARQIGHKEFRFIEWSGGMFGLLIGILQVLAFSIAGQWWLMPIVGALVGSSTNWLAIQMVFRPLEPRRVLGVSYQGMFPKRQPEIARDFGIVAATEVLTPHNLIDLAVRSPSFERVLEDGRKLVKERLSAFRPMLGALAKGSVTDEQLDAAAHGLIESVGKHADELRPVLEDHLAEHLELDTLFADRMGKVGKPEFERMLRGIFEEDEWLLVMIGAGLGAVVGLLQGGLVLWLGL